MIRRLVTTLEDGTFPGPRRCLVPADGLVLVTSFPRQSVLRNRTREAFVSVRLLSGAATSWNLEARGKHYSSPDTRYIRVRICIITRLLVLVMQCNFFSVNVVGILVENRRCEAFRSFT